MSDSDDRTEREVEIGCERVPYSVDRSDRRRARLVVRPSGQVQVRVPNGTTDEWVDDFVRRRARWLLRQRTYFDRFRPRDPERQYINGESLRYLGRQYRLRVLQASTDCAKLRGRHLVVTTADPSNTAIVRELVLSWYAARATATLHARVCRCVAAMAAHGVSMPPVRLQEMKRRWGSCTPKGRIILNPRLVIAPADCIDYVITHELCHLKHARHDTGFYRLLTTVMPDWKGRRLRLEKTGVHLAL